MLIEYLNDRIFFFILLEKYFVIKLVGGERRGGGVREGNECLLNNKKIKIKKIQFKQVFQLSLLLVLLVFYFNYNGDKKKTHLKIK